MNQIFKNEKIDLKAVHKNTNRKNRGKISVKISIHIKKKAIFAR